MDVEDTLDFLLGQWSVARTVNDYRIGGEGSFEGHVEVREATPDESGRAASAGNAIRPAAAEPRWATYEEVGRFRLAHYDGAARRHLRLRRRPDASLLVEFTDGRPFVVLDLRSGHCSAHHDCGDDRYDVTFIVHSPETFEERWRVHGPSKDYTARAVFVRGHRSPSAAQHVDGTGTTLPDVVRVGVGA